MFEKCLVRETAETHKRNLINFFYGTYESLCFFMFLIIKMICPPQTKKLGWENRLVPPKNTIRDNKKAPWKKQIH